LLHALFYAVTAMGDIPHPFDRIPLPATKEVTKIAAS